MLGFWPTASCFLASFLALTSGQSLSLSPKSDNNYINVNNRGFTNVIPKTSQPSQFLLQKKQRELNSQLKPVQERAVYDFTCPDEFEGFYPHETSCDKYWVCEHGIPRLELCGNGLAFADTDHTYTTRSCEYLHHVDCGNRTQVSWLCRDMSRIVVIYISM